MPIRDSRGYAIVGLHNPKTLKNVGSSLRAAWCFGAASIVVQGARYTKRGSVTDTPCAWRHIPLLNTDNLLDYIPLGCETVAVEICDDARNLADFTHPERAMYIFGAEDDSIPDEILDRCNHKVMIPTRNCMNLAATVNVVLYDRMTKM